MPPVARSRAIGHLLRAAVAIATVAAIASGCQLLPAGQPALTCVDVPQAECERQAAGIVADARIETPDKRIVSISISRNDGIHVQFDDGTGWSAIP
jgi:riboflavin biosynthesis pyrimidine reductase